MWLTTASVANVQMQTENVKTSNTCGTKPQQTVNQTACQFSAARTKLPVPSCDPSGRIFPLFSWEKEKNKYKDHRENIRSLIWKTNLTENAAMTAVTVTRGITRWDFNVLCWRQPGGVQKGFDKTESKRRRVHLVAVTQNPCCNCCTASC